MTYLQSASTSGMDVGVGMSRLPKIITFFAQLSASSMLHPLANVKVNNARPRNFTN